MHTACREATLMPLTEKPLSILPGRSVRSSFQPFRSSSVFSTQEGTNWAFYLIRSACVGQRIPRMVNLHNENRSDRA